MDAQRWATILSRIVPQVATDVDAEIGPSDPRRPAGEGRDLFPRTDGMLFAQAPMKRADAVCVGLRVLDELPDAADRAMRVAAFALSRDVEIVVLAHCDASGFERFGFRVERVSGDTPAERACCEDQIRRFWNIDLVL